MAIKHIFRFATNISFAWLYINLIIVSKTNGSFFSAPYLSRIYLKRNKTISQNVCATVFEIDWKDFNASPDLQDHKDNRWPG